MRVVKERTMEEIEILKRCAPRNVVFIGKPGLNKLELAKELVLYCDYYRVIALGEPFPSFVDLSDIEGLAYAVFVVVYSQFGLWDCRSALPNVPCRHRQQLVRRHWRHDLLRHAEKEPIA